jgi:hypothetical protein
LRGTLEYSHHKQPSDLSRPSPAVSSLNLQTGPYWRPLEDAGEQDARLDPNVVAQTADTSEVLTLRQPNPALYTREILGVDEHGKTIFGPKTFHFEEDEDFTHMAISLMSDGMDIGTVAEIMNGLEPGESSRMEGLNGRLSGSADVQDLFRLYGVEGVGRLLAGDYSVFNEASGSSHPRRSTGFTGWLKSKFKRGRKRST